MLTSFSTWFHFDILAMIMMGMIFFIAANIALFSWRHLQGDKHFVRFYARLTALTLSLFVMVSANHLVLFFSAYVIGNLLLVSLMVHKSQWQAAAASGRLAQTNLLAGAGFLGISFATLAWTSESMDIQSILSMHTSLLPLGFMMVAAMAQSAIWPFHKWLLSSLNSPTPVSAYMHAGLINGGGFLLVRFSPLFYSHMDSLLCLAVVGLISAVLGTAFKLQQSDVKRMLAASTMAQMGFMFIQVGLGLFAAAVSHLILHGMFKAYLFLSAGSAAQERAKKPLPQPSASYFMVALAWGLVASFVYGWASGTKWMQADETLLLQTIAFLAATQSALVLLNLKNPMKMFQALFAACFISGAYGSIVYGMTRLLMNLEINVPTQTSMGLVLTMLSCAVLVASWLLSLFPSAYQSSHFNGWKAWAYVKILNASQPHPKTITTNRNDYC